MASAMVFGFIPSSAAGGGLEGIDNTELPGYLGFEPEYRSLRAEYIAHSLGAAVGNFGRSVAAAGPNTQAEQETTRRHRPGYIIIIFESHL